MNPNNIQVGDTIYVEQAWEDEAGNLHDEYAEVEAIDPKDGSLTLDFGRGDITEFLSTAEFYAKDYQPEKKTV